MLELAHDNVARKEPAAKDRRRYKEAAAVTPAVFAAGAFFSYFFLRR